MISERQRPWTVHVIVAVSLVGTGWSLVAAERFTPYDALSLAIGLWLIWGVWVGKSVAHQILFMLASLCAVFMLFFLIFQVFLYETGLDPRVLQGFVVSVVTAALLMQPVTKRFAGQPLPQEVP